MKRNNYRRLLPPSLFGIKMDKIKEVIATYSIWGAFLGVISFFIRPFISIKHSIRDAIITFLVSMLSGLMFEYFDIPDSVRYGLSGVCGLFAVRLFMIAESILKSVEKDPMNFIKMWRNHDKS